MSVIVVLSPNFKSSAVATQRAVRKFVFYVDGGKVTGGKIIEIFGAADYMTAHRNSILEDHNDRIAGFFTGAVITYDVNYHYLEVV